MTIPPSLAQPSISQAPLEELDPNAINKSIIDAKGDLVTGTANDTPARLAAGANGQVLIADSSTTTGLRWGYDPTTTVIDAKGDLLVGTGPDAITRLPVGTNNQVLVADSTTPEGVKWSSETDPNSINKSIIDAKGDLVVGTANDTPARLPIGTNGQYLVANSAATQGVAWTTPNIALGTETTGNYVAGITGGTGVTVTGSGTEGATPSVAIGQDVGTGASVAFGGLNVDSGTLYVDPTNNRVGINDTTPSFSLDVTGDANITTALTVGTTVTASDFVGNLSGILQIDVKNVSGGTLAAGTPVYISGTVGATQVAEVQASRADTASTMPAIGLLETSLAANATGHAAVIGLVNNLNTSTYTLNAPLYVAATGGLTNTRPTASTDVVQVVGFAARLNTNTGAILATIYDQLRAPNSISIPGNIATTGGQFTGSGAGLTNIPAGQLSGTISSTNIGNDSVALGTKTTGNYVQTVSGGTGVSVTGGTGEGSTPSIAIGQAVATTDSPQFAGITTTGTATLASVSSGGSIAGNSLSAVTSISGATLTVDGIEIDTTGATTNQVLQYNGTKFAPTSSGQLSSLIVSANSSTDAVRITQTGTGNALVIEDSTNPDSTPFVVNADGKVLIGNATDLGNASMTVFSDSSLGLTLRDAGAAGGRIIAQRSAGTIASPTAIASGNVLGQFRADGYDGTSYLQAASINFAVDGTVSTGTVPGRIIFSTGTTGTTTERMRIDSAGAVGIGTTPVAGRRLVVAGNLTGAVTSVGLYVLPTIQSDVTSNVYIVNTNSITAAAAFTLASLHHFRADQGTFGAGSAVTDQFGFVVGSSLTGATNNYGFYGNLAAATGRWNLYMAGTADNYLAGALGVGTASLTGITLGLGKNITGAVVSYGLSHAATVQSDVTTAAYIIHSSAGTAAAAFTLNTLAHFRATQGTFGAGSAVGNQYGFWATNALTGATNNYGFFGAIAAGTGRWNLYMNGTADNYLAGRLGVGATLTSGAMAQVTNTTAADKVLVVKGAASQTGTLFEAQNSAGTRLVEITSAGAVGIGGTPAAARSLVVSSNLTGSTVSRGVTSIGQIQSDVTNTATYFATFANTNPSAFTVANLHHYLAGQGTFGATSAVTSQMGFVAENTLVGATNNYGFYGDIASGTNRWNLYMSGTAANYMAGRLGVGATLTSGAMAQVVNTTAADKVLVVRGAASQTGTFFEIQNSASTVQLVVDSSANLLIGMSTIATSSAKTVHIADGTAPTANPTGGGVLYVESGALKYRGSSGTITTIANA